VAEGTAVYLCSEVFNPASEHGLNPLDPSIGLLLPSGFTPIVSDKDAAAPTLEAAAAAGLLPSYDVCVGWYQETAARETEARR
jgi:dTDP-4-dehydrorhamnose 3,5-epimerase